MDETRGDTSVSLIRPMSARLNWCPATLRLRSERFEVPRPTPLVLLVAAEAVPDAAQSASATTAAVVMRTGRRLTRVSMQIDSKVGGWD